MTGPISVSIRGADQKLRMFKGSTVDGSSTILVQWIRVMIVR